MIQSEMDFPIPYTLVNRLQSIVIRHRLFRNYKGSDKLLLFCYEAYANKLKAQGAKKSDDLIVEDQSQRYPAI